MCSSDLSAIGFTLSVSELVVYVMVWHMYVYIRQTLWYTSAYGRSRCGDCVYVDTVFAYSFCDYCFCVGDTSKKSITWEPA